RSDPAAVQLLRAIGSLTDPGARERLVDWLRASADWRVRAAAAEGLTGARAPPEQRALLDALADASPHVRLAAATALAGAPLGQAELDRVERWIADNPEDRHTGGALIVVLANAGRSGPVLAWIAGLPEDDVVRWRRAIEA